ncbi:MAG: Mur ligase family protein [Gemmatimonadota bacterium]
MSTIVVELRDSRRLTGPNLLADAPGAVIDGTVSGCPVDAMEVAWSARATEALNAVGWTDSTLAVRRYDGGLSVYFSAPADVLYAATEVNEWAWAAAASDVGASGDTPSLSDVLPSLNQSIADERDPALLALAAEARRRGLSFRADDEFAAVGSGRGNLSWAADALPAPEDVEWDDVFDIPTVIVTGTNGKTTTVRMASSIAKAAGYTVGFTCTDGIYVGDELLDGGDWSGPGGARAVLRDRRVEVAILETARGGMLRRGLGVDRADAAIVTNVAADHLGEWGILSVADVATAKLVVAKAVRHGAPLIANADDPYVSSAAQALRPDVTWVAVDAADELGRAGGSAAWVWVDGWLVRRSDAGDVRLVDAASVPATMGGAAVYNISNALGAAALAWAIGIGDEGIRRGLVAFDPNPEQSPGRGNLFEVAGATVLVDFVHNAHGFDAIGRTIEAMTPSRVALMIGQAGDRDDASIRDFVRAAWGLQPDRVAIKRMPGYERGRDSGEVASMIEAEMSALGAEPGSVSVHEDEVAAAEALLNWAEPDDVVLLSTQADRDGVLELVRARADQ